MRESWIYLTGKRKLSEGAMQECACQTGLALPVHDQLYYRLYSNQNMQLGQPVVSSGLRPHAQSVETL